MSPLGDFLLASMVMASVPRGERRYTNQKPEPKSKKLIASIAKKKMAKKARKKARK